MVAVFESPGTMARALNYQEMHRDSDLLAYVRVRVSMALWGVDRVVCIK